MLQRLLLFFGCLFLTLPGFGQYQLKGLVTDAENGQPLPFVNIVINDSRNGSTTDVDGKFNLTSSAPIELLRFSYVGYEVLNYQPQGQAQHNIRLTRKI